jgi:hypothetical protein
VDVSVLAYRDALGLPVAPVTGYPTGVRCVLLHVDARAFLLERQETGLGPVAWLRSIVRAKPSVFAWSDPRPALGIPVFFARRRWRHAHPAQRSSAPGNGS